MNDLEQIRNKKILIQTSYQPSPHLETELEIIEHLLEQDNTVYWIVCKSDFQVCFNNPTHKKTECTVCFSRVSNGIDLIKKKFPKNKNLHILEYKNFLELKDFKKQFSIDSTQIENIIDLKKIKYQSYDLGLATASSLVSYTRNHVPDISKNIDFIERGLLTGAYLYEVFQLIFDQISPDLAVLFNGRFIENRPLLRICQKNNIDFATHERGGKIDSFLFRINSTPHSIETVIKEIDLLWENAPEDIRNLTGKTFFENRIKRVEDAWYSFTKEQKEGQLPESFKDTKDKKVITIFNSSLDEYEGIDGFEPFFYENDNEGIKQICTDLLNNDTVKLYLRVHPNLKGLDNNQNQFIKHEIETIDSVEVIAPEASIDTYSLILNSDIIIVFGSTVGIEAAFSGKNVVLLGKGAYQNLDCVVIPKNHSELMNILTNDSYVFPKINPEEPIKFGFWNESFGIKYKNYKPINLGKGTYSGQLIKPNPILNEWRRIVQKLNGTYKK